MRWLLAIGLVVLASVQARADEPARAVALLPLDADAKLELYGQPVASEVARALVHGGIEVVVVGPKMAVPAQARLVVDGTIKAGKGSTVIVTVRIRDASDGSVYDTIPVIAATQTAMDHAAEELSAKVLPSVQTKLKELIEKDRAAAALREVKPRVTSPPPVAVKSLALLVAVSSSGSSSGSASGDALSKALSAQLVPWAAHRHHEVETSSALGKNASKSVSIRKADFAIELDVLDVTIEHDDDQIPLATARVRVRISDPQTTVFDRVIRTNTIVGEKHLATEKLIERIAREVLSIAEPHVRRRIPTWY
ncbi:MAG: hypothetical protein ABI591_24290 [Kofleriaceae bacterium]